MQCKEWDDANSKLFKESHDEAVHKNSYKSRLYELISASLDRSHTKKTEKPIRGSIQVSSTNESGVCALALPFAWVLLRSWTVGKLKGKPFYVQTKGQLFPTCVSYAGYAHQREESPAIALPYCFSVFCFLASFCFPGLSEAEGWKVEFPDVSPLPCPLLYRGCGRRHLGNGIHHLMRSLHPSDTNIV